MFSLHNITLRVLFPAQSCDSKVLYLCWCWRVLAILQFGMISNSRISALSRNENGGSKGNRLDTELESVQCDFCLGSLHHRALVRETASQYSSVRVNEMPDFTLPFPRYTPDTISSAETQLYYIPPFPASANLSFLEVTSLKPWSSQMLDLAASVNLLPCSQVSIDGTEIRSFPVPLCRMESTLNTLPTSFEDSTLDQVSKTHWHCKQMRYSDSCPNSG